MKLQQMKLDFDYKRVEAEKKDYASLDKKLAARMLFEVLAIRSFEETLLELGSQKCVHGPLHTSIGEEACAAGPMAALQPGDTIASSHRAHHHYLSKLVSTYNNGHFDPLDEQIDETLQWEFTREMGEIMGLSFGCCGGRGGSMHLRNPDIRMAGSTGIVGGGIPLATGAAFAEKYNKSGNVVICFLGDGAANQGTFHEAINLAGLWNLPIIYFVENNHYAVGTSIFTATAIENLCLRASSYGLSGRLVDGMDPLAVYLATKEAVDRVRGGQPGVILEGQCYRYFHHAGPVPGSGFGYRTKEEEARWHKKDPTSVFPKKLIDNGVLSSEEVDSIREKVQQTIETSRDYCATGKNGKFFVKEEHQPKLESIEWGLHSDGAEFDGVTFQEKEDFTQFEKMKYVEAISTISGRHLEKDPRAFIIGEEVANFGGGPYGACKGLPQKYPERVFNTPISESGFCGAAGGAAMSGLRPILEIMFPDFTLVAADQLFSHIGRLRYMFGNSTDMPLVARTRIAIGCGYGGQHSMDPMGIYALFSGWRVVAPSNSFDYIGLFNSAMRCLDPVLVVEHHAIYPKEFEVPKGNLDYFVEIGKARVVKPGGKATVVAYSSTVSLALEAAEQLAQDGLDVEVIDLRTVSPNDIDYETIGESLKKTGILVTVEQAPKSMTLGPKIVSRIQSDYFDYLDGPICHVTGLDIPTPVSKVLEDASFPTVEGTVEAIRKAVP